MSDDLLPGYDYAVLTTLSLRCTVCGFWWMVEGGKSNRPYHCPNCGRVLAPAQYPDDPPPPRPRRTEEVPL